MQQQVQDQLLHKVAPLVQQKCRANRESPPVPSGDTDLLFDQFGHIGKPFFRIQRKRPIKGL